MMIICNPSKSNQCPTSEAVSRLRLNHGALDRRSSAARQPASRQPQHQQPPIPYGPEVVEKNRKSVLHLTSEDVWQPNLQPNLQPKTFQNVLRGHHAILEDAPPFIEDAPLFHPPTPLSSPAPHQRRTPPPTYRDAPLL